MWHRCPRQDSWRRRLSLPQQPPIIPSPQKTSRSSGRSWPARRRRTRASPSGSWTKRRPSFGLGWRRRSASGPGSSRSRQRSAPSGRRRSGAGRRTGASGAAGRPLRALRAGAGTARMRTGVGTGGARAVESGTGGEAARRSAATAIGAGSGGEAGAAAALPDGRRSGVRRGYWGRRPHKCVTGQHLWVLPLQKQ